MFQVIGSGKGAAISTSVVADKAEDLEGVDFVIEAVFEDQGLKHKVFQEIEDVVLPEAVLGSNTSSLPITGLADGVKSKENFIGIHFFSPVDKMPLVEIICGKETNDESKRPKLTKYFHGHALLCWG